MLIRASNLKGLPVGALDVQEKIGVVAGFIISPNDGRLLALKLKSSLLFSEAKILSSADIVDIDQNGLVTGKKDNLVGIEDIIRAKEALKKNIPVLGQKALTKSKKYLGKIDDLLFDFNTWATVKYYIKGLWQDKIFPAEKVIKITREGVFFSDDILETTPLVEPEAAAA